MIAEYKNQLIIAGCVVLLLVLYMLFGTSPEQQSLADRQRELAEKQQQEKEAMKDASVDLAEDAAANLSSGEKIKHYTNEINRTKRLDPIPLRRRGLIYLEEGYYAKAIRDFSDIIQLQPEVARGYFDRGVAHERNGSLKLAKADYDKSIELDDTNANAFNNRGLLLLRQDKVELALKDLNKGVELQPEYAKLYYNRGTIYERLEDFVSANADYDKAIELDQENQVQAIYRRGIVLLKRGKFEDALNDANLVVAAWPKDPRPYQLRSAIYTKLGKTAEAADDLSKSEDLGLKQLLGE